MDLFRSLRTKSTCTLLPRMQTVCHIECPRRTIVHDDNHVYAVHGHSWRQSTWHADAQSIITDHYCEHRCKHTDKQTNTWPRSIECCIPLNVSKHRSLITPRVFISTYPSNHSKCSWWCPPFKYALYFALCQSRGNISSQTRCSLRYLSVPFQSALQPYIISIYVFHYALLCSFWITECPISRCYLSLLLFNGCKRLLFP